MHVPEDPRFRNFRPIKASSRFYPSFRGSSGQAWNLLGTALNPSTWLKWLNAPLDPKSQELFAKAANPETAQRWLEALGDPKNTPWLSPPRYGAQATRLPGTAKQSVPARLSL